MCACERVSVSACVRAGEASEGAVAGPWRVACVEDQELWAPFRPRPRLDLCQVRRWRWGPTYVTGRCFLMCWASTGRAPLALVCVPGWDLACGWCQAPGWTLT